MHASPGWIAFPLLLGLAVVAAAEEKLAPQVRAIVDGLEKGLPEFDRAADEFDAALKPLLASTDPTVALAVDSARLQIMALRSVRTIIARQPAYVQWHLGPANLPRWKEGAEHYLECAKAARDPFAGATSGTRPVRSRIDGQLLLYKFSLPPDYDPQKKYPLCVDLHSGGGFTWLAYWVTGKPEKNPRLATSDGAIHISPAGRQHIGIGEASILDAIDDAKRHYAVDEDRVVIGGASWGGTGGFHFAAFLPEQFAAAYSLTGGGNYNVPVNNSRFDAYLLPDNFANLPFVVWDTPGDGHFQPNHAFADALRERGQKFPGFYPHRELTDPKGGHGNIDRKLQDEGWTWMRGQVRNRYPKLVVFKTGWLRYDGAYWARIDTMDDPGRPARIEAKLADASCRIELENVDRFHLDFATELVGKAKSIAVQIDGGNALEAPAGKAAYFWRQSGQWSISPDRYPPHLVKKLGVCGPIQDVFMERPVLMVYGAGRPRDKETTAAMLDNIVNKLISEGDGSGILRTGFERKADTEIDEQDLAEKDLIVVGTRAQNRLLARIADKLPVTFLDDGVRIAGKDYRGPTGEIGLAMVYPNPLNPERYVLLLPEIYSGTRPLDYPDWVVLQAPKPGERQGRILGKGLFDARWRAETDP